MLVRTTRNTAVKVPLALLPFYYLGVAVVLAFLSAVWLIGVLAVLIVAAVRQQAGSDQRPPAHDPEPVTLRFTVRKVE